ncbi:MAG: D-xylose transporter XylE [Alphaproteobacteria bacterium]|nr:MAG: D-xylose transporter XylE [Alphaproteobacteria bacterium]
MWAVTGATLVATLGGLLFGYDTAVISGAVGAIDHNFIAPKGLSETAANSLSGFTIASALLGTILGAAVAGWVSSALGRKRGMILAAVLFFISALGSAWPEMFIAPIGGMGDGAITPFIVYRILGGIGVGLASMLSPMYIAEIAPSAVRGRLVAYNQIAIVSGMSIVYFVNWAIASQGDSGWLMDMGWRWMFASECLPALAFFAFLFIVPESPRWLVMKDRVAEAQAVLDRFNDPHETRDTMSEIRASLKEKSEPLFSYGVLLIVVGILLSVFQQFVGINSLLYYAPFIFQTMGFEGNVSMLNTVLAGVVNVAFTLVAVATVDKLGRRPLMIIGGLVMAVSMITLGTLFHLHLAGIWALVAICVYLAGFALSWGPVVWVLLSEIFPNSIRAKAMPIAVAAQWIANWVVSSSFKVIDGNSALNEQFNHGFAYWMYGAFALLAAWFMYRFVPETKGVHLEDMGGLWHRNRAAKTEKGKAAA